MNNLLKRPLIKNTIYILLTNFIIRFLGLFNRVVITRILGIKGMSLYVLIIPTIFLFITISTMSINISTTKIISESLETKKISPKKILIEGSKLLLKSQIITIVIFLFSFKYIATYLLKNNLLILPLLFSIPSYIITGYTDLLKGYYNGLKKIKRSCNATLIEQMARIISSIILVLLFKKNGIVISVSACVFSDTIGELISLLYLLIYIKKDIIKFDNTSGEKEILRKMTVPQTLNRLINCFTMFLEPIIFTNLLLHSLPKEEITNFYTIFTGYSLPLISIFLFIPHALNSSTLPHLSEIFIKQNINQSSSFLSKTILFSLIPGIISTIIIFFYAPFLMNLLYKTDLGVNITRKICIFYILYYIHLPLINTLIALGKTKLNFITSSIMSVLKLLLMLIFINKGLYSIIYASIIVLIIHTFINFIQVNKLIKVRFNSNTLIKLILITIITICINILIQYFKIKDIFSILLLIVCYLGLLFFLKSSNSGRISSSFQK